MNDVQQIQISIDTAKKTVKNSDALNRLYKNRDFLHLIEEFLFKQEPVRLVHLLNDPSQQTETARAKILKEMDMIAGFADFLRNVDRFGTEFREKVAEFEAEQERARQELSE